MINCAKCGRENEDHYKFCLGCGASLEEQKSGGEAENPVICPQCNSETTPGQRFCGSCGFNLQSGDAPKPAAAKKGGGESKAAEPKADSSPKKQQKKAGPSGGGNGVAALIMINPDGSPGEIYDLQKGDNIVGRSTDADVFARDEFLSPEHARFTVDGKNINISDLNSLNGVYYRITDITELSHGDYVRIGQELLRFQLTSETSSLVDPPSDDTEVAGSNLMGAWGVLERISGPGIASLAFVLRNKEQKVGRERGDILFRDDGYVSGTHARVFTDGNRYFVEDLKSSNGTFVRIRGSVTLPSGSLILMGKQPFRLQVTA